MLSIEIDFWQLILIAFFAFTGSALSFFSGFGLGTILLPVFSFFYDVPIAIALTGVVHLLNNIFKLSITWKDANFKMVSVVGLSSIFGAILGAKFLQYIEELIKYSEINIFWFKTDILKITIGLLIIFFSILELRKEGLKSILSKNYFITGGLMSGFFGGLSGHQGALRSLFIGKSIFDKKEFIATGICIACLVDLGRLPVYFSNFGIINIPYLYLFIAVISAFLGAYIGKKKSENITDLGIRKYVFIALLVFGVCMILGLI